MYGVSKITTAESIMLISFTDASSLFMCDTLQNLADAGVVVDMICQTPPSGSKLRFSFTAPFDFFGVALKAIGAEHQTAGIHAPMISGGYSKINLFGTEMVTSVGVASRALATLSREKIEIAMITTSDLDISVLLRTEDEDFAVEVLRKAFEV